MAGKKHKGQHHWSGSEVLQRIRMLKDRSAKITQRNHPDLYGAALRFFGNWRSAIEKAGFDYSRITKRKTLGYWTESYVISEIKKSSQKNSSYVRKHRCDLYSAAIRIFGSWKKAIETAGYQYKDIRKDWIAVDSRGFRLRKRN